MTIDTSSGIVEWSLKGWKHQVERNTLQNRRHPRKMWIQISFTIPNCGLEYVGSSYHVSTTVIPECSHIRNQSKEFKDRMKTRRRNKRKSTRTPLNSTRCQGPDPLIWKYLGFSYSKRKTHRGRVWEASGAQNCKQWVNPKRENTKK